MRRETGDMRIAIAELNGEVNQHFGQTRRFALLDTKDNRPGPVQYLDASGLQHRHEGLANLLKSAGVETVITGGIGPGAISALEAMGFEVITGAAGKIEDVALLYAQGKLVSTGAVCGHHHDDHQHHHHHH
ncbi:diguanylate cyclase [Clostridiales bacterium PH28_bin88]|nr:diguanylate cyclase [Clostridiales bacterium PH28_bin88]